jgi:eukaryotic-like serine/threonine-protein kinase
MQESEGLPLGSIPINSGEVLAGKYRVDRILGVGGMGVVVAATHLQLHQQVALKFMLPEALRIPSFVERFAREARAAARLKSDHVARVLDVGTLESGSPYMVMEYLEGSDLGTVIETRGALPIEAAVDCVLQACDAVAEAHSIGIVHRDLKPRNLFLTQRNDGRALVKVLDFGIAKHKAQGGDLSLTKTTDVMGSPNYMSPEQLRASRAVDDRSDIWALGVILYELLTGLLPFAAESVTQLIAMVLTDHPRPIRGVRFDVPEELARIIERCLEKDPAARFASVAELALALAPFAPADTRDLAIRIARIKSGSRPPALEPVSGAWSERGPSGTTAKGWAKTELARSSRRKLIALGTVASVVAIAGLVGAVAALRPSREPVPPGGTASAPSAPATGTEIATAVLTPSPTSIATLTPTAAPTPTPTSAADAGLVHPARPRRDVVVPAASASTNEPPRYRTTW